MVGSGPKLEAADLRALPRTGTAFLAGLDGVGMRAVSGVGAVWGPGAG